MGPRHHTLHRPGGTETLIEDGTTCCYALHDKGTFVYYTAADEHVRALLAEALFHAEHADRGFPHGSEHRHQSVPVKPSA